MKNLLPLTLALATLTLACNKKCENMPTPAGKDIATAEKASIDRFSAAAGHLFVRTGENKLPAANAPISFDAAPFLTEGFDRTGAPVKYYDFDAQSRAADDIYVFFKAGATTPVAGQNNVIPTIPGDPGYNDLWAVNKVTVPDNYVPNSLTSEDEITAAGYPIEKTNELVNCPVVPFGSTAARSDKSGVATPLLTCWYKGKAVTYFNFGEAKLTSPGAGAVPVSNIFVQFNDNAAGPASGFKTEPGTRMTHNVLATLPGDAAYSPLWSVQVLDNQNFAAVTNLATAQSFPAQMAGVDVNCPVVK